MTMLTKMTARMASRLATRRASTMQICEDIASFRQARAAVPAGATVGFVPTMGGLHAGHMSLIAEAKATCDVVVSSVFVNPAQFGPNEDFDKYPRTFEADMAKLREQGVDIVFAPTTATMYLPDHRSYVDPVGFDDVPEGQCRPGFFRGVATVVAKLFNIVSPTHAFFGQKDAVQCVVIKRLIEDLNFPITLRVMDTMREDDGLAMSTRNQYLSPDERVASSILYAGLRQAKADFDAATTATLPAATLRATIERIYRTEPLVGEIQYISIGSKATMEELVDVDTTQGAVISVAVKVGACRLIDNIVL
ncbi:pantoate-beta-alanine ligase, variant [Saprolegnia diclina VS20]|uniref:Pantoate--beta-alanine ligase n=1 Tax=Saprolegnia diclina (strain VS20) TaxID=1156394 RepID=T0QY43_SAPDV|nr:pantoate-beta-alanine ligase [Saprolegnia diclina VS20]XP_008606868.1 pantoate-beta-alanine ligase, variant [Saprolegnia diclina VS20]EQC39595.1 pantoate-beta-alanine ligase [Saprolegnia diclina VS20]EQC39596.1 pantoate-beta-alanine ligase, variant [Saprolegnia diclina VS20]|eukprot:XP_008606867.1 pantoate-beta-alanine ligase [Saprolegnia diclina VS20]